MKKKELSNLRAKRKDELSNLLSAKRAEIIKIKASMKVAKEKNLKKVKNARREVSQILTLIREREIFEKEAKDEKKEN